MPRPRTEPALSTTWLRIASLRLDRQHITKRLPARRMLDVVDAHVAIQAQVMSAAELQLNARLDGLRRDDVRDALWQKRTLVKTWAMRGALHLMTAQGLWDFVAAAPTRGGWETEAWLRYFEVTREELTALMRAIEQVLDGEPRTRADLIAGVAERTGKAGRARLAAKLASGWGTFLKPPAARGHLCHGPDAGRNVTFVKPADWLGLKQPNPMDAQVATGRLVERFLRLFPGAGREGVARWWGSSPARIKAAATAAHLPIVDIEIEGSRGWALADDVAALERAREPVGVRLLPNFDAYVNDLPRRVGALLPVEHHDRVHRVAGWVSAVVIVDGRVAGTWQIQSGKKSALAVQPFATWRAGRTRELKAEVERIATFLDRPLKTEIGGPLR
jgi:winged helix DNA-binding protein